MASIRSRIVPTPEKFKTLQFRFGYMREDRVQFPSKGSTTYHPPSGKIGIPVAIIKVGIRLPVSEFFDETIREYFFFHDLTPNTVN